MTGQDVYASRIEQLSSEDGGYWVVSFPDIPGCLGVGDTAAEAEADARTALVACLDAFKAVDRAAGPLGTIGVTASPFAALREAPGCVNPVPAEKAAQGFRLLTLRCYHSDGAPPSFAWIDQRIFRAPSRESRHGLHFGLAFRPEIMSWLIDRIGRPSLVGHRPPQRNPDWPTISWRGADRRWPDDTHTTEWFAEVAFASQDHAEAFEETWRERLAGGIGD